MKETKIFKTREDVAKFREDLERGTQEKFKEIDRQKRMAWQKAKEIVLD